MAFFSWSTTAGTNATADGTISWSEGQAPSSVNDSARAMMARLKEWGNDTSGALATGGTSSAYTLTTNQVFTSLSAMGGACIAFIPNATNAAGATLNVDGLGAKALQAPLGTAIGDGVLVAGTPYVVTYSAPGAAFLVHGFFGNAFNIPVAGCMDYFGTAAPNSNFVFPFGQAISRTTYSVLFGLVGTTFGAGDGSTTFNVPDLRGRVSAGKDNMGGSAASRIGSVSTDSGTIVGTTLGSAAGSATHAITQGQLPAVSPTFTGSAFNVGNSIASGTWRMPRQAGNFNFVAGASPGWDFNQGDDPTGIFSNITPSGTISALGSGTVLALLPPTMMVNKIMRVI